MSSADPLVVDNEVRTVHIYVKREIKSEISEFFEIYHV